MDHMLNVVDRDAVFASESEAWSSPFAGGLQRLDSVVATEDHASSESAGMSSLESPFSRSVLEAAGSESETEFRSLLAELHDEEFEEALQGLIDEAAGRYLTAGDGWSGESGAGEVEAWLGGLAERADQLFEHLEQRFGNRTPESLLAGELEGAATEALAAQGPGDLVGEQLFGSIIGKLGALAKRAATFTLGGLGGKVLGRLIGIFRGLVPRLLRMVIPRIARAIPESLRPGVAAIAAKLGITVPGLSASQPAVAGPSISEAEGAPVGPGAGLAELFDRQLALSVSSDSQAVMDQFLGEWESPESYSEHEDADALARLDAARATLTQQLTEAAPGSVLTAELEQFIPAVMAVLPLARTVLRIVGRDKLLNPIAALLASGIQQMTGIKPVTAVSRAIADKALQIVGLEAEAPADRQTLLGAEALVSTVEDTVRAVGQLPPESLAEPLRLRAELQEAFAEAATRHVPSEVLRPDLDGRETEGESGVWVLMPRSPSRRYRYRKHNVVPVRIGRPVARTIVLYDGGTLEDKLLDEGTLAWPAEAEVHLYEALPGTHLGHLAAAESGPRGGPVDVNEFEHLTPQTAGLLFNQPGLGRSPAGTASRRYYRVVTPGRPTPTGRRVKRVGVRITVVGRRPVVRVHVRLSEREAVRVGALLAERADVRLVAMFRSLILAVADRSLPGRLQGQAHRALGMSLSGEQARTLATALGERMVTAVAAQIRALGPTLAAATRDPASGVTLTFEFGFADTAALAAGRTDPPAVSLHPGRHHG